MFRPIKRKNKDTGAEAAKMLLSSERRGVLAVNGENGYPYAVPVNFIYLEDENKICFHGARAGYKHDMISADSHVCFTVYGNERIKDEQWAPYLQSAVVFGRCTTVEDKERAMRILRKLAGKYYPDASLIDKEIAASGKGVEIFEIEIEHISGKEIQEK